MRDGQSIRRVERLLLGEFTKVSSFDTPDWVMELVITLSHRSCQPYTLPSLGCPTLFTRALFVILTHKSSLRLDQALAKCAESEQASAALTEELVELRQRVSDTEAGGDKSAANGSGGGEGSPESACGQGGADEADGAEETPESSDRVDDDGADADTAAGRDGVSVPVALDGDVEAKNLHAGDLEQRMLNLQQRLDEEQDRARGIQIELEQKSVELEDRLAEEQARARSFQAELEVARGLMLASEKNGDEAMAAAATEAARAAEAREELDVAESELKGLRGRLVEFEEESVRASELKATLEITRDTVDEIR